MTFETSCPRGCREECFFDDEGCFIVEYYNTPSDSAVSVARARVPAGGGTALHRLEGVCERYCILHGEGIVEVDGVRRVVRASDTVLIPPGASQRIVNCGSGDLVFLCICTPRFTPECYVPLGERACSGGGSGGDGKL